MIFIALPYTASQSSQLSILPRKCQRYISQSINCVKCDELGNINGIFRLRGLSKPLISVSLVTVDIVNAVRGIGK